jgi:hypothetical protein
MLWNPPYQLNAVIEISELMLFTSTIFHSNTSEWTIPENIKDRNSDANKVRKEIDRVPCRNIYSTEIPSSSERNYIL